MVFCDKLGIDALSGITALQNAVAFLTSALTMAMSISTFLWLLSFFRPLDNDVYLDASGYRLWYPSHPLFYFIIAATILSLGSGLFSIVALWISSYIQNSFAIMASPLLLYYTQSIIFNKLGLNGLRFLSFSSVFHFTPGFSSPAAFLLYMRLFADIGSFFWMAIYQKRGKEVAV